MLRTNKGFQIRTESEVGEWAETDDVQEGLQATSTIPVSGPPMHKADASSLAAA
jgi:hypothetical protein